MVAAKTNKGYNIGVPLEVLEVFKFWKRRRQVANSPQTLAVLGKEFKKAFAGSLVWQWDDRFNSLLLHIDHQQKAKVVKLLEKYFSDYWHVLLDESMPEVVNELVEYLHGLRPEQLLFSTNVNDDSFLYCAWWPWQDGTTISVRIALYSNLLSADEQLKLMEELRQGFLMDA